MSERDIAEILKRESESFEEERSKNDPRPYVRVRPPSDPSQVYSLRLPVSALGKIQDLAKAERKRPTAMLREWVIDRLEYELNETRPLRLHGFYGHPRSKPEVETLVSYVFVSSRPTEGAKGSSSARSSAKGVLQRFLSRKSSVLAIG